MQVTLKRLSELLGIEFTGNGDTLLTHVCGLDQINQGGLAYIVNPREIANLPTPAGIFSTKVNQFNEIEISDQAAVIVPNGMTSQKHNLLVSPDPMVHHCLAAAILHEGSPKSGKISAHACIGNRVKIGMDVTIDANAVIYDDVIIGDRTVIRAGVVIMDHASVGEDCLIYPNVTIRESCLVGNRVIIHPGVVIGADGFGFYQRDGKNMKIPQVGIVEIRDDVEIGANSTIDRARFNRTVIGSGSKLDNLIHIAHNVELGEDALIAAQSGIAGSTKTGHHLMMAGQSGIKDHLLVGNNVSLLARTLITSKTKDSATVAGMPSRPIEVWRKIQALINNLDDLFERIKGLEAALKSRAKD